MRVGAWMRCFDVLVHHHAAVAVHAHRSEEHTSELQSQSNLVCRLLLEKKKTPTRIATTTVVPSRNVTRRFMLSTGTTRTRAASLSEVIATKSLYSSIHVLSNSIPRTRM